MNYSHVYRAVHWDKTNGFLLLHFSHLLNALSPFIFLLNIKSRSMAYSNLDCVGLMPLYASWFK